MKTGCGLLNVQQFPGVSVKAKLKMKQLLMCVKQLHFASRYGLIKACHEGMSFIYGVISRSIYIICYNNPHSTIPTAGKLPKYMIDTPSPLDDLNARQADMSSKLAQLLQQLTSTNPPERARAINALQALGDLRAIPALITALADADEDVCLAAVEALGVLRDPHAIPALFELVNAPWDIFGDDRWHNEIYLTLQQQSSQTMEYLLNIIINRDLAQWERFGPHLYSHCLFLLDRGHKPLPLLHKRRGVTLVEQIGLSLLEASKDINPKVREYAVGAFKAFHDDPGVMRHLLTCLRDPEAAVCQAAARSLHSFDLTEKYLKPFLHDESVVIRTAALTAISKRTMKDNIELLLQALDDPAAEVRFAVLERMTNWIIVQHNIEADLINRRILPRLLPCLRDKAPSVRAQVINILWRLHVPDMQKVYQSAMLDEDATVREEAVMALRFGY